MAILGKCECCGINVSDEASACPHCGQPNPYTPPDPNKGPWSVILINAGSSKINVTKVVREITALGLKEAQNLVENLPQVVRKGLSKSIAERLQKLLSDECATAQIR